MKAHLTKIITLLFLSSFLMQAYAATDWVVLFDGEDRGQLRGYKMKDFPSHAWEVKDGMLVTKTNVENVDIITKDTYKNFELVYDWKVSKAGNSGLFFHIKEISDMVSGDGNSPNWMNDFEIQILDDVNFYDKAPKRTAGALYDLIAPTNAKVNPYGVFNQARLVVNNNHVEHYLNGIKVVDFTIGSPELQTIINNSKFNENPIFGTSREGHIMFQHHGQKVWFKNMKVRKL